MMAKRVLIVMTTALGLDGISSMVLNHFKHFHADQLEYEFVIWNEAPDDLRSEIESRGGIIHTLPLRTKKPLQYYRALKRLMLERSYSIIHAQGNSSTLYLEMLAAKRAGIPNRIPHSHNSMCSYLTLHKLLKNRFSQSYTHAFACSKKAGDWLFRGPYEIVNNGIELEKFTFKSEIRDQLRSAFGLNGKKVVGHVGNYNYAKNHDFLIDIFAALVNRDDTYRLILVGAGELMETVRQKIKKLELNAYVLILGPRTDAPDLFQAMDCLVMPSRFEGLPLVLVEAQASGVPCVVSDQITQEINITDLLTYVPLEKDPEQWAGIIAGLPRQDRCRKSIEAGEKLRNAGYDIKLEARKLENRYLDLIERSQ